MLYPTLQCAASSTWTHTWRCARSCRREADGKMEDRREDSIVFSPSLPLWVLCHLVMRLLAPCLVLSLCFPSFSINPFRLFILSQTPGIIISSFPTSCFFSLDTFYQCFSHLWPYFYQLFRTLLQAKTLSGLILVRAGSKHITHNKPEQPCACTCMIQIQNIIFKPFQCDVYSYQSHTQPHAKIKDLGVSIVTAIYFSTFTNNYTNVLLCQSGVTLQRHLQPT